MLILPSIISSNRPISLTGPHVNMEAMKSPRFAKSKRKGRKYVSIILLERVERLRERMLMRGAKKIFLGVHRCPVSCEVFVQPCSKTSQRSTYRTQCISYDSSTLKSDYHAPREIEKVCTITINIDRAERRVASLERGWRFD